MTDTLALTPGSLRSSSCSSSSSSSSAGSDPHRPVVTPDDLLARVRSLVPVAVRRQLWTLFLDADDVQLPMVVPLEGVPELPDRRALERWGDALDEIAAEFAVASVVFVLERPGPSGGTASDLAWRRLLVGLAGRRRFSVRAVLTCGSDGVAVPDAEDSPPETPAVGTAAERDHSSPRRLRLSDALAVR